MLGHTKIQTTQIYAKILDKKVSNDMQALRNKFQAPKIIDIKTGS
jgi:integrase/recombinase XerD